MFKLLALIALVLGVAYANLEVNYYKASEEYGNVVPKYFPPDNGGNFGDYISGRRQSGDRLVYNELVINDDTYSYDANLNLTGNFRNTIFTQVRAVNVGRQRAYIQTVTANSNTGDIKINGLIKIREQIRLIVQIFGR